MAAPESCENTELERLRLRLAEAEEIIDAIHRGRIDAVVVDSPEGARIFTVSEQRLAEEQLHQAQRMEALGQLTTGVAHDFNNMLGAVVGGLNLIERRVSDPEVLHWVRHASQSAMRGAKLVDQLLAFARKQHLVLEPVNINRIITGILDLIERTIGPTIQVVAALDAKLADALADANQIEMMLVNLSLNARDAMPGGGILRIETSNMSASEHKPAPADLIAGDYVRLSVIDSGAGMSAETKARAIEPFYTTKAFGTGSGLGLSQVYGVAKQFGGTIRIESVLGKGTGIHIYLPRVAATFDRSPDEELESAVILVVDDDPIIRELSADLLSELGYRTIEADSGRRAMQIIEQNSDVDALFTDIAMPKMNGFELAAEARKLRPGLPILLMTGYADFAKLPAGRPSARILKKPFRIDELEPALKELLRV